MGWMQLHNFLHWKDWRRDRKSRNKESGKSPSSREFHEFIRRVKLLVFPECIVSCRFESDQFSFEWFSPVNTCIGFSFQVPARFVGILGSARYLSMPFLAAVILYSTGPWYSIDLPCRCNSKPIASIIKIFFTYCFCGVKIFYLPDYCPFLPAILHLEQVWVAKKS